MDALQRAAALLSGARLPVIGGLFTDIADRYYGIGPSSFGVPADIAGRPQRCATVPCQI